MKANSERIKGKNFRQFAGKPLFQWILQTLLSLEEIDLVVINTDAREILARHGLQSDGKVIIRDRKPHLCGDCVSMNLVLADDVTNVPADCYVMTHTTNPLLSSRTIQKALAEYQRQLSSSTADSLFAVNRFTSRFYRADGTAVNHDPKNLIRTQDLEPWFEENSNLYVFSAESFEIRQARIGAKPALFETPRLESFDIDDLDGWQLAEIVATQLQKEKAR